jgi:hypothetical protein
MADQVSRRLDMLYQFPLELAAEPDLRSLYKRILTKVMEVIPGGKRGALLTMDPGTEKRRSSCCALPSLRTALPSPAR